MSIKKVWVEEECTICGVCEDLCPEVINMGDETTTLYEGADFEANE